MFLWWFLVSIGTELFSPKKEVIKKNRDKGRVQAFLFIFAKAYKLIHMKNSSQNNL